MAGEQNQHCVLLSTMLQQNIPLQMSGLNHGI